MSHGAVVALLGLALFSAFVAFMAGRGEPPRWPSGWRHPEAVRSASASTFLRGFCLGLAALLLLDILLIVCLPWRVAGGVIAAGGLVALVVAGCGG